MEPVELAQEPKTKLRHGRTALRLLSFPVLLVYLELVLRLYMGLRPDYLPVVLPFALSGGSLLAGLTAVFPRRGNGILFRLLALLLCLVYAGELLAKQILQTYYPLTTLATAADNRLGDYSGVILTAMGENWAVLAALILPGVLLSLFAGRLIDFAPRRGRYLAAALLTAAALHLLGLGALALPWQGDLIPGRLYQMDTETDDQVEQLGLLTTLRLDIKHLFLPPKITPDRDFEVMAPIEPEPDGSSSQPQSGGEETPAEPQIDTSPNILDVDLAALGRESGDEDVQWLADYFASAAPTKKNEYTGMFAGYNVIQIVLEGFSGYAIDPELTPTLYKLSTQGFVFSNYYTTLHYTSTSNGECQTLLGLYPKNGNPITMKRTGQLGTSLPFTLAQQLGRVGYLTLGYHGNYDMYGRLTSHTNLGYDWRQYQSGLELEMQGDQPAWPQRDSYVVEASTDDFVNSHRPFHVYYLTISGHMPYSDNRVVAPYRDIVRALPYSAVTQNYVATVMEADRALKCLLDKLEAAGKLERTLIVATGDHIPYFNVDTLEELTGKQFGSSDAIEALNESAIDFDVYKNTLILWSAGMTEPVPVDKVCCQVDILPTLSNLLGLPYDSRMLAGRDVLSDSEGLVVFSSRSWRSDRGFYDRYARSFTPAPGVEMTAEEQAAYVAATKKRVGYLLDSTPLIVEHDFYSLLPRYITSNQGENRED